MLKYYYNYHSRACVSSEYQKNVNIFAMNMVPPCINNRQGYRSNFQSCILWGPQQHRTLDIIKKKFWKKCPSVNFRISQNEKTSSRKFHGKVFTPPTDFCSILILKSCSKMCPKIVTNSARVNVENYAHLKTLHFFSIKYIDTTYFPPKLTQFEDCNMLSLWILL